MKQVILGVVLGAVFGNAAYQYFGPGDWVQFVERTFFMLWGCFLTVVMMAMLNKHVT